MANVDELDTFIDEMIRLAGARNYHPTEFIRMRQRYGTAPAIERLVKSGEVQSGFLKLQKLDMLTHTIEAAVLKFSDRFSEDARECAKFRLDHVDDKAFRAK